MPIEVGRPAACVMISATVSATPEKFRKSFSVSLSGHIIQQFLLISPARTISPQPHPQHRPPKPLPIAVVAVQTDMQVYLWPHQPRHFYSFFSGTTVLSGNHSPHEQMMSYCYLCYDCILYTPRTGYLGGPFRPWNEDGNARFPTHPYIRWPHNFRNIIASDRCGIAHRYVDKFALTFHHQFS